MPTSFPCQLKQCSASGGFAPSSDVSIYNLQDSIAFNSTDISILVECLEGYYWPPGSCPRVITFRPGTFTIPIPPTTGGFPIVIQLQGCLSLVSITLPAGSSTAAITAAANAVILQVAAQQAQCDAINPPGDDSSNPDNPPGGGGGGGSGGGGPNPLPKFFNQAVYYTCFSGLEFTGSLPSWVSVDAPNSRLVAAARTFGGETQAAANATAQTVLNSFAGSAFAEGTLTCVCEFAGGTTLPEATEGVAYSFTLTLVAGTPGTFSIQSGALPEGLTLDSVTGEISGIPTESGFFDVTVRMDKSGTFCVAALEMLSNATECLNNPSPTGCGEIGEPFSTTLMPVFTQLEGFPFVFSIVAGALPDGLSLNSETGVISGTPETDGTFVYTVQLVNGPITCTKEFSCTIISTLCFDPSQLVWQSVNTPAAGHGGNNGPPSTATSTMVGSNGSFALVCYDNAFADASHAQQKAFFTTLTPEPAGCRVRLKVNYSYELPDQMFADVAPNFQIRLIVNTDTRIMTISNPPFTGWKFGSGEYVEEFDLPPDSVRIEFRTKVTGANFSVGGGGCGVDGCPSRASGTFTLEPLPP